MTVTHHSDHSLSLSFEDAYLSSTVYHYIYISFVASSRKPTLKQFSILLSNLIETNQTTCSEAEWGTQSSMQISTSGFLGHMLSCSKVVLCCPSTQLRPCGESIAQSMQRMIKRFYWQHLKTTNMRDDVYIYIIIYSDVAISLQVRFHGEVTAIDSPAELFACSPLPSTDMARQVRSWKRMREVERNLSSPATDHRPDMAWPAAGLQMKSSNHVVRRLTILGLLHKQSCSACVAYSTSLSLLAQQFLLNSSVLDSTTFCFG